MMEDFFSHQDRARTRTRWLVFLYATSVVLIVLAINLVALFVVQIGHLESAEPLSSEMRWNVCLYATLGTIVVILLGTLNMYLQLGKGGRAVARLLGGRLVPPDTAYFHERQLLNIVEEIAIASGMPVPDVFVLDRSTGINAFAAGYEPTDAVIGVTRGCLQQLNRSELQGVIAHEFSHIVHGDSLINLRLVSILNGILMLGMSGYAILRALSFSSDRRDSGAALAAFCIGIVLIVVGYVGVFFGRWIKASVSRQREYLADASAVQYTRDPKGLTCALAKIAINTSGSRIQSAKVEYFSHMYFSDALKFSWNPLFATHPPLESRLKRLDPKFDLTTFKPEPVSNAVAESLEGMISQKRNKPAFQFDPNVTESDNQAAYLSSLLAGSGEYWSKTYEDVPQAKTHPKPIKVEQLLGVIGNPDASHRRYAEQVLQQLPKNLHYWVHTPEGAKAIVYAILLSENQMGKKARDELQDHEAKLLSHGGEFSLLPNIQNFLKSVNRLDRRYRLTLIDLSLPSLRRLGKEERVTFLKNVDGLTHLDQEITLFEFVVDRILHKYLSTKRKTLSIRHVRFQSVSNDIVLLLGLLAQAGAGERAQAEKVFAAALSKIGLVLASTKLPKTKTFREYSKALDRLDHSSPQIKKTFLRACLYAVSLDGSTTVQQSELVRGISEAIHCPMPPLLA